MESADIALWISGVQAASVAAIGMATVSIARKQAKIAEQKLKFDQYQSRRAIYEAVVKLINKVVGSGRLSYDDVAEFNVGTIDHYWLFGHDMEAYIGDLYDHGLKLASASHEHSELLEASPKDSSELKYVLEKKHEERRWFVDQPKAVREKFQKYLRLTQ